MSPEDQKMFDEYFELFMQPGWSRLMTDLEENLVTVDTIRGIPDDVTLYRNQGKLEILQNIISLKLFMENLHDDMTKEDNHAEAI
jgi:hypothetical protein